MLCAPANAGAAFPHTVAPGESLSSVAASDGLSVEALAAANGLPSEASLNAGSTLMIPEQSGSAGSAMSETAATPEASAEASAQPPAESGDGDGDGDEPRSPEGASTMPAGSTAATRGAYVVRPGDTLSAIAERAATSVTELAAANGLDPNAPLLSGTVLTLSGSPNQAALPARPAAEATPASAPQPEGSPAEGSTGGPPFPTEQTVSPSEVGSVAAENGVPASLAEAIASQESGFNNNLTSSAGAQGVMQILPETWNWINENLAQPAPLEPASAASNVRGGVLLLHSLLESSGGNQALAAAGYYQGLGSVLENGELPSTQQYVESVLSLQQQFGGG
jgi:LysM repeat protein